MVQEGLLASVDAWDGTLPELAHTRWNASDLQPSSAVGDCDSNFTAEPASQSHTHTHTHKRSIGMVISRMLFGAVALWPSSGEEAGRGGRGREAYRRETKEMLLIKGT